MLGAVHRTLTFKPYKRRRSLTVEENVLRAAKAKVTRQKRGTLGKKQRAAIKAEGTPDVQVSADGKMTINGNGSEPKRNGTRRFTV